METNLYSLKEITPNLFGKQNDNKHRPPHLKSKRLKRDWVYCCYQIHIIEFIVDECSIIYDTTNSNANIILAYYYKQLHIPFEYKT